jgi:hypothetical protein
MFPHLRLWGRRLLSTTSNPFKAAKESSQFALATVSYDVVDRKKHDDSPLLQL